MASLLINPLVESLGSVQADNSSSLYPFIWAANEFFPPPGWWEISTNRTQLWNAWSYTLLLNCWFRAILGWLVSSDRRSLCLMPYWPVWNKILTCPVAYSLRKGQRWRKPLSVLCSAFFLNILFFLEDDLAFIHRQGSWWHGLRCHALCNTGWSTVCGRSWYNLVIYRQ